MGIPQAASLEPSRAVDNMSGSPVATADNNTPRPKTARRRGRGRGGRGSLQTIPTAPNAQSEARETPQVRASESSSLNGQPNESLRAARGSRGGKRGGRGGGASQDNRRGGRGRGDDSKAVSGGLGGRTFEGRLSRPQRASDEDLPDDTGDVKDLSLRADAPDFVPGAPTNRVVPNGVISSSAASTTGKGKSKNVQPRTPKVTTKSTAPDIATRIHEDIAHNLNGQKMKDRPPRMLRVARKRGGPVHRAPGAALAVIFHTRSSRPPIPVGVRRKSTPVRYLACPHTRAVKPAHGLAKAVRIRAMRLAMLVLVRLVPRWARLRIVSVGGIRRLSAARIQITRTVGAVGRYAVTCFPAANTLVLDRAMRAFTEMLCSSKDEEFESQLARGNDVVPSIAECTFAKKVAILRTHTLLIVRGRRMSFLTVLAGRRRWQRCLTTLPAHPVRILYPTARSPVARCWIVDTLATRSATPAPVCTEKTPCASTVTVTCGCGRLRQSRRCNAAAASKGPVPQTTRGPSLTPLTCDDECARLERNRALASALGVEINPSTTVASNISPNNLPYSTETLDMYIQLSSTSPLSTLQTYESTLHSLSTSTTQRSVRFQPARSPLRAFIHSLAADWGFASESLDPEPHRHVFVLKPTTWTPPLLGFGPENSIGIGGKSVGECVKLRERQRLKEREAQRLAAAEAKALKEAAKAQQSTDTTSDGGWAQVAASRRSNGVSLSSTRSTTPVASPSPWSGSKFAALAGAGGDGRSWGLGLGLPKKEKLVLRSGVGAAKKNLSAPPATEVADDWEEEEEKVEQEEEREREREQQLEGEAQPIVEENGATDSGVSTEVEMPAEAPVSTD
ncbi:hypothetical protein CNMCM5793_006229 [Aspergillus hiratsukae]|uniref:R3H domain-containing protein n=1 Tax=Aspergillus hiratsukae TaxID=1194566 RepID=A0A8H6UJY4_9EURO|nr:hypothetical protein CNMCM5793_006229 [Aspergillus hiratsukae]KAF7170746.1 hypothetical protein CNMCM6106_005301 [Aspergillus hiratsukae]